MWMNLHMRPWRRATPRQERRIYDRIVVGVDLPAGATERSDARASESRSGVPRVTRL
jgi:hypothetical protein